LAGQKLRWLVPFPTGGGYDVYSRLIRPHLANKLNADISVENVPGAGGIVGAVKLKNSPPDGRTVGILNAAGLLVAALTEEAKAPHPAKDFTLLARVSRNPGIWATSRKSAFQTIDDLFAAAEKRPILFSLTEVGSTHFMSIVITSSLFGVEADFLAGFSGSREKSLAAVRGEADVVPVTFESVLDWIESGDLRPLLQISSERISPHPSLNGVPLLGGDQGVAARRAAVLGRNVEQAKADAQTLASVISAGVVVAAPPGLEPGMSACLQQAMHEVLTDPAFQAAAESAKRTLDVERADAALAEIRAAAEKAEAFVPLVREAIKKIRT
jgi:tripartite-type tricarboxylate transporter receptor subunit TctC